MFSLCLLFEYYILSFVLYLWSSFPTLGTTMKIEQLLLVLCYPCHIFIFILGLKLYINFGIIILSEKVKHELRNASYELTYASYQFIFTSYKFKFTSYKFKSMSYDFKFTNSKFNFASC